MRKNYMTAPTIKDKTLSVTDMSSITGFALNESVGREISPSLKLKSLSATCPSKIIKMYNIFERIFVYAEDGVLYEFNNGLFRDVKMTNEIPLLTGIVIAGKREVLVQTSVETFIVGGQSQTSGYIPKGDYSAVYKGKLFVADKNKIYFGGPFSFDGYSFNLDNYGFIGMPIESGTIKGLTVYCDALLIFTTSAIYKLTLLESVDYLVERVNTPALAVVDGTCTAVGDAVYFISGNRLARYKSGSVSFISSSILSNYFSIKGQSAKANGKYILPVFFYEHGVQCAYCYDTNFGIEQAVSINSCAICEGGIVADDGFNTLFLLSEDGIINHFAYWGSKVFDFGSATKKVVSQVSVCIDKSARLIVKGDFGRLEYLLEKGRCVKRLNLCSKTFEFEIIVDDGTFSVEDFKLKYRTMEN